MKTIRYVPFLTLLVAGCGAKSPSPEPIAMNAEVRLLGGNAGDYGAVLVGVKDLTVTDGLRRLAVEPGQTGIDLTKTNDAWLAGTVAIPVGVEHIHVALTLDDFGGYQNATAAGDIDARSARIEFDTQVAWLTPRKMATVRLDVGGSLASWRDDTMVLMPRLDVAY